MLVNVTPDTDLETVDLNWTEDSLPQSQRTKHIHGLHPYMGKFIPQLAEVFIRKFFRSGQRVIDPFCGSGTTLAQANELGVNSVGYDISAFNVLLSRVKTDSYDLDRLGYEIRDIIGRLTTAINQGNGQLALWGQAPNIAKVNSDYLQEWYSPQSLQELMTYLALIESGNYRYADLLKIILSRSARSTRSITHYDLDSPKAPQRDSYYCHKHKRICHPTEGAVRFLVRYSKDTFNRVKEWQSVRTGAEVITCHADSRLALMPGADGVITSPPYVGLINYHDQHRYAYHILGLEDKSNQEIGSALQGTGLAAIASYKEDIAQVLRNVTANLPSAAPVIIIANDRHEIYPRIAEMSGLRQVSRIDRQVNRRTGRRRGSFIESVFVWETR